MALTCGHCSRTNPPEAAFCYFDGTALTREILSSNGSATGSVPQRFPTKFVFPDGTVCRTFDELALACQQNWRSAVELLRKGYLESFFGGMGRADLALAAREAAGFPDQDRGLDQLLARFPSRVIAPPKLEVSPREINLGQLAIGEDRSIELHLANQGMRLLCGSVSCEDCVWLAVGEPPGASQKIFQFEEETIIPVQVRGKQLRAGNRPLEARLAIESNGGAATVVVRAEIPVRAFPEGILAGARSPRQVAEKAKAAPREAAALFEKGAVARWYESNGWSYPVQGPPASGLGAVQQFFEALGLTPAPKLELSPPSVRLYGRVGERLEESVELQARERRPVYAHASSNQPWLEVGRARLAGRTATVPLVVPTVPDRDGQVLQAVVTIRANGNQCFQVPVTLDIGGGRPFVNLPTAGGPSAAAPQPPPARRPAPSAGPAGGAGPLRRGWFHALPAVLLAVALGIVFSTEALSPPAGAKVASVPEKYSPWRDVNVDPAIGIQFNDRERFGIVMLKEVDPDAPERPKRLTYKEDGQSGNTCVYLDGQENLFGQSPGQWLRERGRTLKRVELSDDEGHVYGWKSVWEYPEGVHVTQTVKLLPGDQTRQLDTCFVGYELENRSTYAHAVGLRVMLDTFIGANDGVPFAVPGQAGLLDTWKQFGQKEIPDYIEALERPDLANPGTIARVGLKLANPDLEPLEALLVSRWPGNSEERWDWKPRPMSDGDAGDSCVTLYWARRKMSAGETRRMGFTYGLGSISTAEEASSGQGLLALTAGGAFRPDGVFTVTAYVKNPRSGQRVSLEVPRGLGLLQGEEETQVLTPQRGRDYTQVSWRVRARAAGEYLLRAAVPGVATETFRIRIRESSIFD